MKFIELKRHIAAKQFCAAYAATGEDAYLVKKSVDMFVSIVEYSQLNLSILEDGASEDSIQMALSALPFMSPFRLVIMDAKLQSHLKDYLKNPQESTIVLLRSNESFKPAFGVEIIDCDRLPAPTLMLSIASECQKNGEAITDSAARLLIDYCARFMGKIRSELYKLMDLRKNGETITEDDVKNMVVADLEYKVFELSDAICTKNATKALTLLDDMLLEGYGAAIKVFGLLYSHFRRLLAVSLGGSGADLAVILEVKDFAIKAAARQAAAFSRLKLKRITDRLHNLDYDIKSGKTSERLGLESFIIEAISEAN